MSIARGISIRAANELVVKVPGELMFFRMEMRPLPLLIITISGLLSPSKSATTSETGFSPFVMGSLTHGANASAPLELMF